jgi:hypothetical protein
MSTPDIKSPKNKILNTKLLTIAAVILLVLALLFMATPLLSPANSFQGGGNSNPPFDSQSLPGGQNGFPGQGIDPQGQGIPGQNGVNVPNRQFSGQGGLPGFGLLMGVRGTIVYAIALLISLAAAAGMFMAKRWGKIMGIIMAVIYGLLALINLLPTLLISIMGIRNPMNLILSVVHLLLAIAVIVLAAIPAKKNAAPSTLAAPPIVPA